MAKKVNPYNVLAHSWGKSPEQKAKEKAYNHKYYLENKNKWKTLYNDTVNTHGGTVDSLNKSIAGAEARVTATKNEYDKAGEAYNKALNDYRDFLNTIPKVGSQRTREQNRMLEDRQERLKEMKADYEKVEKTYRNAQNDLKNQMTERDRAQGQINRIKQRADRAQSEYDAYENSEAGESERYKREMKALRTRQQKNEEAIQKRFGSDDKGLIELQNETAKTASTIRKNIKPRSASEAQALAAARRRAKILSDKHREYDKKLDLSNDKSEYRQRNAERYDTADQMRALASKRRASAMARSAQAAQQKTQESRKQFQKQQQAVEQQANRDISTQKQRATNIQRQMKATQDRVSQLMETLNDGMSKGYNKNNNYMQKIAKQIKDEQDKLAKQREQLNTVNTAIKTFEKKAKQAHGNI
jgi:chromosome segregation ATPase